MVSFSESFGYCFCFSLLLVLVSIYYQKCTYINCPVIFGCLLIFESKALKLHLEALSTQMGLPGCGLQCKDRPLYQENPDFGIFRAFLLSWSNSPEKDHLISCWEIISLAAHISEAQSPFFFNIPIASCAWCSLGQRFPLLVSHLLMEQVRINSWATQGWRYL